jgi:hypothetical protein
MKPIRLFEEFINESQRRDDALRKVLALPNGFLSDAKRIDAIFETNNRPWSELVQNSKRKRKQMSGRV